jgi:single-stranded DNA-binding protein
MSRWTGTGHLTKDPKLLETNGGTAICTLRIAVKRAGKQGEDGYFDVTCFDGQARAMKAYAESACSSAARARLVRRRSGSTSSSERRRVAQPALRCRGKHRRRRSLCHRSWPTQRPPAHGRESRR